MKTYITEENQFDRALWVEPDHGNMVIGVGGQNRQPERVFRISEREAEQIAEFLFIHKAGRAALLAKAKGTQSSTCTCSAAVRNENRHSVDCGR